MPPETSVATQHSSGKTAGDRWKTVCTTLSSNTEDRNESAHGSSEQGNVALRTWQYPGLRVTEVVCPQEAKQGYVPEAEQGRHDDRMTVSNTSYGRPLLWTKRPL